jgi:hypothetical protein
MHQKEQYQVKTKDGANNPRVKTPHNPENASFCSPISRHF